MHLCFSVFIMCVGRMCVSVCVLRLADLGVCECVCVLRLADLGVCECVCVLRLADLGVCEISQSQHQLAQGTLPYAQLLVFEGFVMVCVGVACFEMFPEFDGSCLDV